MSPLGTLRSYWLTPRTLPEAGEVAAWVSRPWFSMARYAVRCLPVLTLIRPFEGVLSILRMVCIIRMN